MRVLHMNVRQGQGGAAKVAMDLATGMIGRGWNARFLYGYGPKGRPELDAPEWCIPIATPARSATNLAVHRLVGRDVVPPSASALRTWAEEVRSANIVHLHAMHSYWLPLRTLRQVLTSTATPIVWTMHDHWNVTGRCAQPGGCVRWQSGCGQCPQKQAYPGGRVDLTASTWREHRDLLGAIPNLTLVACAQWLADELESSCPGFDIRHIPNGTGFLPSTAASPVRYDDSPMRVLVVGTDLSHPTKQDPALIHQLAREPGVRLTTAGRHSPFHSPHVLSRISVMSARQRCRVLTLKRTYYCLRLF